MRVFSFPCFRHFMTRHFGVLTHSPSLSADLPSKYVRWRKEITNVGRYVHIYHPVMWKDVMNNNITTNLKLLCRVIMPNYIWND